MIYTITFNPSLDYIMHVNDFKEGETNRSVKEAVYPGGKGFNVSTIISRFHIPTKALGFIAGFTGQEILNELQKRDIDCDLCQLENGISRINVKMKGSHETEINGNGPNIPQDKLDELFEKLDKLERDDILVLAGSIPSSLPHSIYEDIMKRLSCKNIKIIVDATNDLLKNVLKYHPFLIKPNHRELEELFHTQINTQQQIVHYAKELQKQGAINVIVSLGKDGAILVCENQQVYYSSACKGILKNSVGSGDSMVAGFIVSYSQSHDYKEALRLASACGSATAFSDDLASLSLIKEVYNQIDIIEITDKSC